jgi:hypothetical protein
LARTVSTGESRDQFILMAQVWLRLAEEQDPHPGDAEEQDPHPVVGPGGEPPRAVQQQQQQQQQPQHPQPEDDADGS